ncbi:MAG TPA: NUDIX domain-containing protein [Polyangia bacterium]
MKRYSLGFAFGTNQGGETVLLIRKVRPAWQHGLLNGIGGHIEEGETPIQAMVREFEEECGVGTKETDWTHYMTMRGPDWEVYTYWTRAVDLSEARTTGAERVVEACTRRGLSVGCLSNVAWMIEMSKDPQTRKHPLLVVYESEAALAEWP